MTRSLTFGEFLVISKRNKVGKEMENLPSEKLEEIAKAGLRKEELFSPDTLIVLPTTDYHFQTLGALDVLRERHGEAVPERLTGYRLPKTMWEKIVYFFNQKPIPLEAGHQYELGLKYCQNPKKFA